MELVADAIPSTVNQHVLLELYQLKSWCKLEKSHWQLRVKENCLSSREIIHSFLLFISEKKNQRKKKYEKEHAYQCYYTSTALFQLYRGNFPLLTECLCEWPQFPECSKVWVTVQYCPPTVVTGYFSPLLPLKYAIPSIPTLSFTCYYNGINKREVLVATENSLYRNTKASVILSKICIVRNWLFWGFPSALKFLASNTFA